MHSTPMSVWRSQLVSLQLQISGKPLQKGLPEPVMSVGFVRVSVTGCSRVRLARPRTDIAPTTSPPGGAPALAREFGFSRTDSEEREPI